MGLPDVSPTPKKDSMGMDYIPVYEGEDSDDGSVKLSPGKIQRTGVKSEPAARRVIRTVIRAPGTIQLDERRVSVISMRAESYVQKVADVTTGAHVVKGQPLMEIYSPAVSSAAAEYISTLNSKVTGGGEGPYGKGSRQRLMNLDVPEAAIAAIEKGRNVPIGIEWTSPRDGIVLERNVTEGMRAQPGDVLFRIADHRVVWAIVDVAERDLGSVAMGQRAMVRARSFPGREFSGKINVIYPQITKETRTARVRVELPNPELLLIHDMYVDAEIETGSAESVLADSRKRCAGQRQPAGRAGGQGRRAVRAARGQARPSRRGLCRGPRRPGRGRSGGDISQFPDRCRKQSEGGAERLCRGSPAMIARLIAWSARNLLLVFFGTTFAAAAGLYALAHLPLDAIPDLSDTQVIVYTEYPGQAPQVIEDQVTYPLTTAMLTVPRSKVVRGFSFFGVSFVYVIFEDGTDIYWARSRVLEFLNSAASRLPAGVTPTMGPDATGVGWVYQYAVMSKELNLSDTRAIQDWNLKFALAKAEGVAEVASVGGFVRQYNVVLDPQRMRDLGITMQKMRDAIRASNADVGGRTVELSEFEYVIRGKGYLRGINDLGNIVLKASNGTPVLLRDIARVELGPDERRGITELNGEGEVASGIVLQRFGVNALDVIQNVKKRFAEIASSLPKSVEIVPVYDRSNLINAAIDTLKNTLLEECIIVALVCIVFLLHVRSALVAILMLPVGVLMAFGAMKLLGLGSNIMSLGGIAIAIGAMVDAAIVMIENAHKHLERAEPGQSRVKILIEAATEVGPALFFSLLIITVSFMPIFTLEAQEGRLFSPLAFTKTFAMAAAAVLSVTLVPALMVVFVRGKIIPEHKNPINRFLIWIYRPVIKAVMRAKILVILIALGVLAVDGVAGPAARHRVHAQSERGHAALHADHAARTFRHQGGRIAADAGPDHPELSRSGLGVRQGRPRRDRDRSGADRDVRDHHQPETEGRMAGRADARGPHGRNGQGAAVSRRLQRLDPADQGAHRHALDGDPHPDRRQGDRHRSGRDRPARKAGRAGAADGAGDVVGLCRARHRRLLSRHRARPRGTRALRHHDPGRAGRHRDRARRADRDDHGRGPPALFRQHALSPRPAQRPRSQSRATSWCRCRPAGRCRWGKSQKSRRRAGRPRSGPRTASSRSTSMSISGTATSAVTSPTPSRP